MHRCPLFHLSFPFYLLALALGAGCVALLPLTIDELLNGLFLLFIATVPLLVLAVFSRRYRPVYAIVLCCLCGVLVNGYRIVAIIDAQLPLAIEGKDLRVQVRVDSLPEVKVSQQGRFGRESISFYAMVEAVIDGSDLGESIVGKRIRLSWYQPAKAQSLVPGQHWRFTVRLKRPRGTANPNGFDYQAWLLARGISASGYVRGKESVDFVSTGTALNHNLWRYRLASRLFDKGEGAEPIVGSSKGLLKALLVGDKSAINADQWAVLQNTGTVHLMAISGLHIGLAAAIGFWLGKWLSHILSLWQRQGLFFLAPLFAIVFASAYAGLAGFSLPTQRALVMVVLFSCASLSGRQVNYWHIFAYALCVVCVLDPFAFKSPGFWLSFGAVAVLVMVFGWRRDGLSWTAKTVRAQLWILLGLAVPLSFLGLPVALSSPLANFFAVPFVSIVIVPLLLLAGACSVISVALGLKLIALADFLFGAVWFVLEKLATWDLRLFLSVDTDSHWAVVAGIVAMLLLLSPKGLKLKMLGVVVLMLCFFPRVDRSHALKVTVLDVQQGLAMVLSAGGHHWVYDTGARYSEDFDMGARVVVPFLRSERIDHLEGVVISHGDNDHAGGYGSLAKALGIDAVFSGEPERLPQLPAGVEPLHVQSCRQGQSWQFEALDITVLWPPEDGQLPPGVKDKGNNYSCVVVLSYLNSQVLILGDVEKSVELALLAQGLLPENVDVVIVAHHGSRTSSALGVLEHIKPRHAVFSVGYKNRYRHPHKSVVQRFEDVGASVLRTDTAGAITLRWDSAALITVEKERMSSPKPWYW